MPQLAAGYDLERLDEMHRWISGVLRAAPAGGPRAGDFDGFSLTPASSDASFRRYFRVTSADGEQSLIVMDAPPDREDCRPFVHVARVFAGAGLHVPRIHAVDLESGFLLLDDLGDRTYLSALDETTADALYRDAITALVRLQRASRPDELPEYGRAVLERELMLFPDWYISRQLGHALAPEHSRILSEVFGRILDNNLAQPRVYVHRDYHSRNLMVCDPNPGVLDFQDALHGPITYDLVSLLRDAYISWEEEKIIDWAIRYWETARRAGLPVRADFAEFYRDFEWMGVQRQLKVVGIFARLAERDGKRAYIGDQPRVLSYLGKTCARYRELDGISRILDAMTGARRSTGHTF